MEAHHLQAIQTTTDYFARQPEVQALLLGGSLAHGWARPESDVDVLILVAAADHAARAREGRLHFYSPELCAYPGGYVDGKYLSLDFLPEVAARGSEPARFAFQDARVLFSRGTDLAPVVADIARYPSAGQAERQARFYAQFEAWHWFAHEAFQRGNAYLLGLAVAKLALFGGRLILTHNELLYPYHKWFLAQVARAPRRPLTLMTALADLHAAPSAVTVDAFFELVRDFAPWPAPPTGWPAQFMRDSELNWLTGDPPIDDL